MKAIFTFTALAVAVGALASCASMSKKECLVADWQVVGQNDGAAGYSPQDRFAQHVKSCSKVGILPDQTLWRQGFDNGLSRYCTPMSGLTVGRAGKSYSNVCPPQSSEGFLRGYNLGRSAYSKQQQITSKENAIRSLQSEISQMEAKRQAENDAEKRHGIGTEIRRAQRRTEDIQYEIDRLHSEMNRISRDIDWFTDDPGRDMPVRRY